MKRLLFYLLVACSLAVQGQTNKAQTVFVNGAAVPATYTAPGLLVKGSLWFDLNVNYLKVYNGTAWIAAGNTVSNLSLGTITATTVPVSNSNGTGFTIPAATTSLAGLMMASDKAKLDGISGTGTFADGGLYTLNGTGGNTVTFSSIGLKSASNGATIPAAAGAYFQYISSGTGFPTGTGLAWTLIRTGGSLTGAVRLSKSVGANLEIFAEVGASSTAWGAADTLAVRGWVNGKLAGKQNTISVLPVSNGGTGKSSVTSGAIQKGNGTGALQDAVPGTDYLLPSALASYEPTSNKSTSPLLGSSNSLFPSQAAVKGYVDNAIKQDTVLYAGGGTLATIPTLPGKRRITVVGSGTFPNVNLPASPSLGDVLVLTGGVYSVGGTANYYNNAAGDLVEGNDGTGLKVTTTGTAGYLSVQVGSTVTLMLISTSPRLYHVISIVGQVTFN